MSRRVARWVQAAVVVCSLAALLALVSPSPPPSDVAPIDPLTGDGSAVGAVVVRPDWDRGPYWEIVERDVFSQGRQNPDPDAPPWTPPSRQEPASVTPAPAPAPAPPRYQLTGIIHGDDGITALIDADPSVPGPELYRPGDRVGPYRLAEATDSTVVLTGPAGTQVLRLRTVPGRLP
jgi:hypothetical protein